MRSPFHQAFTAVAGAGAVRGAGRLVVAAGLLTAWAALSDVPAAAAAAQRIDEIDVTLPDRLGDLRFSKFHRFKDKKAGVALSYKGRGIFTNLFVYDDGQNDVPDGADSSPVRAQFAGAKTAVETYSSQWDMAPAVILEEGYKTYRRTSGTLRFLHASWEREKTRAEAAVQQPARIEHLLITAAKGRFVKVRFNYFRTDRDAGARNLRLFMTDLARLF